MGSVNVHQAKTSLSRLLVDVEKGEDIVIARAGKPVARLTKVLDDGTARALGRDSQACSACPKISMRRYLMRFWRHSDEKVAPRHAYLADARPSVGWAPDA